VIAGRRKRFQRFVKVNLRCFNNHWSFYAAAFL
jgi:hypothetical protein